MAQLCECFDSPLDGERQAPTRPNRPPNVGMGVMKEPEYLSVPNFQDCLGTKMGLGSSRCMPAKRPSKCQTTSWQKLVALATFEKCV